MAQSMKRVTELGAELTNEERNLLSVAYKVSTFCHFVVFPSNIYFVKVRYFSIKFDIRTDFKLNSSDPT